MWLVGRQFWFQFFVGNNFADRLEMPVRKSSNLVLQIYFESLFCLALR